MQINLSTSSAVSERPAKRQFKVSAILEQQEVLQKALTQFNHDLCPPNSSESHEIFDKEEMLRQIMRIGEAEVSILIYAASEGFEIQKRMFLLAATYFSSS